VGLGLLLSTGGMPSSHSALVTGAFIAVGLQEGFNSALFAIAFVVAMIVVYDATGCGATPATTRG